MGYAKDLAAVPTAWMILTLLATLVGAVHGLVGQPGYGYETSIDQVLPAGAWKKIRSGGCLVGRSANVVVDPRFPNIIESLDIPGFIGGQLCDWLDQQWLRHKTVGATVLKPPRGLLKFAKSAKPFPFEDHMKVTIKRIDMVDYERVSGVKGHVPLPWMTATFVYDPPTPAFGEIPVAFVVRGADPGVPTEVHLLISPEISKQLRLLADYTVALFPADFGPVDTIKDGAELPAQAEQPLLLRNFLIIEGLCAFLDGRLLTRELGLCHWAQEWAAEYPSASAIMRVQKADLFRSSPAGFLVSIQLLSPEYSSYKRLIAVSLKPSTELAGVFQEKYDKLLRDHREL